LPIDIKEEYGMVLTESVRESPHISKRFGKLTVFCSPCAEFDFQLHGNYRLIKKADFSFIGYNQIGYDDLKRMKIFCNGKDGIIIPTKYL